MFVYFSILNNSGLISFLTPTLMQNLISLKNRAVPLSISIISNVNLRMIFYIPPTAINIPFFEK